MYLENDRKKRQVTLKRGDRCIFNSKNGRLSFSRKGVMLMRDNNDSAFLIHIGHPVSTREVVAMIAESHGFEDMLIEERSGEGFIYEFK